jgi:hypothetical protein
MEPQHDDPSPGQRPRPPTLAGAEIPGIRRGVVAYAGKDEPALIFQTSTPRHRLTFGVLIVAMGAALIGLGLIPSAYGTDLLLVVAGLASAVFGSVFLATSRWAVEFSFTEHGIRQKGIFGTLEIPWDAVASADIFELRQLLQRVPFLSLEMRSLAAVRGGRAALFFQRGRRAQLQFAVGTWNVDPRQLLVLTKRFLNDQQARATLETRSSASSPATVDDPD